MAETTNKQKAAWVAIAVCCVSGFEGLRQVTYLDPVGIPTACFGETANVRMGEKFTVEQCKDMLADSLRKAHAAVERCVKVPMPPPREAGLTSFTYNVGGSAFCGSTLVRKLNAGDVVGACDELRRWTTARGVKLPGLVARREQERTMCLAGVT